jgi:hypothetical protein
MAQYSSNVEDERRSHFRIDDDVYLEYLVLNSEDVDKAITEFQQSKGGHFNPLNQLQAIAIRQRGLLDSIRRDSPAVGAYLASIDERIQLLAHAIAQDQVGVPIVPNESVNLSAGGLSFSSEQPLEPGAAVEFSIIIAPSYIHICALGKVVYCHAEILHHDAYPFRIGIEFTHVHEADRDALLRHVEEKQLGAAGGARI